MTAKRKGRGSMLARLEDLEGKEAARVEEVRAWNWSKIEAAYARLSAADRAALRGVGLSAGDGPADVDELEDLNKQCAGMSEDHGPRVDVQHAAKEEAQAWEALALDVPDGVRLTGPPAGRVPAFVSYFEEMGAAYDALACAVPLSPLLQRLARICAALERFTARLCEVLGKA